MERVQIGLCIIRLVMKTPEFSEISVFTFIRCCFIIKAFFRVFICFFYCQKQLTNRAVGGRGRRISVSSRLAWSTQLVPGQPGLHSETVCVVEGDNAFVFSKN